jgi:uncharacterized protein YeaO (DUF488 family)
MVRTLAAAGDLKGAPSAVRPEAAEPGTKTKERCFMKGGKAMVKIKRIYDPVSPEDGKRIYIDRLWPRGLKKSEAVFDEWLKEISPSDQLRKWFGHDPARWEEFKKRYKKELEQKRELLEELRHEARKGTITLLYSAKDTEHNNAVTLKEVVALP